MKTRSIVQAVHLATGSLGIPRPDRDWRRSVAARWRRYRSKADSRNYLARLVTGYRKIRPWESCP